MFAPVRYAYRDHLIFSLALVAYVVGVALSLTGSDTWVGLLALPIAGALPFLLSRTLRRFLFVFLCVVLGGLGLLVMGELLFRARYFGTDSILEFIAYSPLPPTVLPGFVSPSGDPEMGDVFTPHARTRINGNLWEINDQGFRDKEFSEEKPADTYRILVLGDSFALGVGVAREDRFSDQLERMLQQVGPRPRMEVYNLGLAGRTLPELAHLMEKYGPRYDADLVLIAVRASQLHEAGGGNAIRPGGDAPVPHAATFSFLRRYSFVLNIPRELVQAGLRRAVALVPAWSSRPTETESLPSDGEGGAFETLLRGAAAYAQRGKGGVAVVVLRKMEFRSDHGLRASLANRALGGDSSRRSDHEEIARRAAGYGLSVIDTYDAFDPDSRRSDYIIFPGDGHPNAAGHHHYAEAILAWLNDNGYLAGGG